jgi:hypothetical protein
MPAQLPYGPIHLPAELLHHTAFQAHRRTTCHICLAMEQGASQSVQYILVQTTSCCLPLLQGHTSR